ncbi:NAD-dependent epimerase/dehydratase family protein [Clostridium rectalis]|uniref:NAD-dependent epimerase/dehydratase family protein n=1 Tax=Clostridium rectalis TaxID=2040295 RepID=UPI000F62C2CC|nr:NAD(P)-dependent oxidoreductase [Clostridium rectalis]
MIAVLGASGFIGQNIQEVLIKDYTKACNNVLMIYFNNSKNILKEFNKISFDEFIKNRKFLDSVDTLIICCGNSNTHIEEESLYKFLIRDTKYILQMKDKINCNIIFLSSAAVYDGNLGYMKEDERIYPYSLYGICKYNSEMALKYIMQNIKNKKLIIYRLTYGYGKFERNNRLMPLIKNCIKENKVLKATGYNNYLNPLSAEFIAKTIIETSKNINIFPESEIINLTSIRKLKLKDILNIISKNYNLKYELVSEEPSIKYSILSEKIEYYLKKLSIPEEFINEKIIDYFK